MSDAGQRIRERRLALGLTQRQVAERGGLRRVDVGKVETGHNRASTRRIRAGLAKGLEIGTDDVDALLDDVGAADVADAVSDDGAPHVVAGRAAPSASSLAERAWYAYHCLPRDRRGKPPSYRSLQRAHGLGIAALSKLFDGADRVEVTTLVKLANALNVTTEWLVHGTGSAPTPTGWMPPWRGVRVDWSVSGRGDVPGAARPLPCMIDGRPWLVHGVAHGAEAEDLRAGIERLLRNRHVPTRDDLQKLLDDVNACDSLAFLEARDGAGR